MRADGRTSLSAPEAKRVCDAYGIPVPGEGLATSRRGGRRRSPSEIGYPVVLKIVSPDILHKTEAKGVLVGLESADEVSVGLRHDRRERQGLQVGRRASPACRSSRCCPRAQEVLDRRHHRPDLRPGRDVRPRRHPRRGPARRDVPARARPRADDAPAMVDGIRAAEVLRGVRGRAGVDRYALAATITARLRARRRLPGDHRGRPQPRAGHARTARSRSTRASSCRLRGAPTAGRRATRRRRSSRSMTRLMQPRGDRGGRRLRLSRARSATPS